MVTVEKDIRLEVLDWGGSGRSVVLLTGFGNNAHIFDRFAPKLTKTYHVYGITRRGFAPSSKPATGYSADRLGDDVLGVIDSLGISRPVLVGHSIAGQELSSIGSGHPEKIAGLVYLDAGYGYAYYDSTGKGNLRVDWAVLRRALDRIPDAPAAGPDSTKRLIHEQLDTDLPLIERDLREMEKNLPPPGSKPPSLGPDWHIAKQIVYSGEKYTTIPVPVLALRIPAPASRSDGQGLSRAGRVLG